MIKKIRNYFMDLAFNWVAKEHFLYIDRYSVILKTKDKVEIINDNEFFEYEGKKYQLCKKSFGPMFKDEFGQRAIISNIINYFRIGD